MIQLDNLGKTYINGTSRVEAIQGIDLTIEDGDIYGIIGLSGAGKSTLLQIAGTLMRADSGDVVVDGVSLSTLSDSALSEFRNRRIGFIFQSYHLLAEFTALENVMMPMLIAGAGRKDAEMRARKLLDMVAMSHRTEHKPHSLSGGEQQRVAIARALINDPAIVLADEPTGNLDTQTRDDIQNLFFELRERTGQTFLIVTHDETLALRSDRKIVMQDGTIVR